MWIFLGIVGDTRKISLVVFILVTYTVPGLIQLFDSVEQEAINHARSMRMGNLEVFRHVFAKGQLPFAALLFVPNMGMAWNMLPMLEALNKSTGGLGVFMHAEERGLNLDGIFAICLLLIATGWASDQVKRLIYWKFPFAGIKKAGGGK